MVYIASAVMEVGESEMVRMMELRRIGIRAKVILQCMGGKVSFDFTSTWTWFRIVLHLVL